MFGQLLVAAAEQEKGKNKPGPASALLDLVLKDQLTRTLVETASITPDGILAKRLLVEDLPDTGPFAINKSNIYKSPTQLADNAVQHFLDQHTAFTTLLTMAMIPITLLFTNGSFFAAGGATAIASEGVRALKQTGEKAKTAKDVIAVAWALYEKEDGSKPHLEDFKKRLYVISTVSLPDPDFLNQHLTFFEQWNVPTVFSRRSKSA